MFLTYFHNLLDTLMLTFHNFFYSFKTQFLHFYLIFMFFFKIEEFKTFVFQVFYSFLKLENSLSFQKVKFHALFPNMHNNNTNKTFSTSPAGLIK